jgi:serine/threonine-protein phosphatase 4 regulatory subunit 4
MDWEDAFTDGSPGLSADTELDSEKEIMSTRAHKTEDEINALSTADSLSELDRAIYILKSGSALQKTAIITHVCPNLIKEHISDAKTQLIPLLIDTATNAVEASLLSCACALFTKLVIGYKASPVMGAKTLANLVPLAKSQIQKSAANPGGHDTSMGDWEGLLVTLVKCPALGIEIVESEIIPETSLERGLKWPSSHRCYVSRLLAAISTRIEATRYLSSFTHARVEQDLLPKIKVLCQDTDYEVRCEMCNQLEIVARAVGLDACIRELVPEYLELLNDEEDVVREAAVISTLALCTDFLDETQKRALVIQNFKRQCESPTRVLPAVARSFGAFLLDMKDLLDESDIRFFMSAYQEMAVSTDETLREMAAFNFPVYF